MPAAHAFFRMTFIATGLIGLLAACSTTGGARPRPEQVFFDASDKANTHVTITGYLRYNAQTHTLYPADKRDRELYPEARLPVLVGRGNESLIQDVSSLDSKVVTIVGRIDTPAEPHRGLREIEGLVVESISTAQ